MKAFLWALLAGFGAFVVAGLIAHGVVMARDPDDEFIMMEAMFAAVGWGGLAALVAFVVTVFVVSRRRPVKNLPPRPW